MPDEGPFFHGTKADLRAGDLLTAGFRSNYRPEIVMNHVYFTALVGGAARAAAQAGRGPAARGGEVGPAGPGGGGPGGADKKFPGNPTRSYRSSAPLRVVREVAEWPRLSPEELASWRARLAALRTEERGEIIN